MLISSPEILLILLFAGLIIGLAICFPVPFVMLGTSLLVDFLGAGQGFFHMMILRVFETMQNYILASIILFVFMIVTSMLPSLFLILAVLGTIFFGVAAPTEAAVAGAFASTILALCYGRLDWKTLKDSIYQTIIVSSMILLIVVAAFVFTGAFMMIGGGDIVKEALISLPVGKRGIPIIMMSAFFFFGLFMEWIGIVPILVPIFTPIIADLGFNPLWAAILFCVTMQTSFLTPPMAPALFYIKGVAPKEVDFGRHIVRGTIPYIGLQLIGLALVAVFPQLALWLPSSMIK